MPPLGNDIVDIVEGQKHRPQFYERLKSLHYTSSEFSLFEGLKEPFAIWLLWTIKEAAYKMVTQTTWKKRFSGKYFEVLNILFSDSQASGTIHFKTNKYPFLSRWTDRYIYTSCSPKYHDGIKEHIIGLASSAYIKQSVELKKLAEDSFFKQTKINVKIKKDHHGIPHFHTIKELPNALTLTHHGLYGAFAFEV